MQRRANIALENSLVVQRTSEAATASSVKAAVHALRLVAQKNQLEEMESTGFTMRFSEVGGDVD